MSCQAVAYKSLGNTPTVIAETAWKQSALKKKNEICNNNQSYNVNKTPKIQQREVLWEEGQQLASLWRCPHMLARKQECVGRAEQGSSSFTTELSKNIVWQTSPSSLLPTAETANIWQVLHFPTFGTPRSGTSFSWNIQSNKKI